MDAKQTLGLKEQLPNDAYHQIFQVDPVGVQIFEEMCAQHYDIQSYDRDNTHETAFNEGRREVMHWLMVKISMGQTKDGQETG